MKKLSLILLLIGFNGIAQIKGNNTIETRNFTVTDLHHLKINLYAKVTIDQSAAEGMSITADRNLFDLITSTVNHGILELNQKEWISPSQDIIITIGAPNLARVESGTHDETRIININSDLLRVNAPVGNITIEGRTKELRLGAELATIDASKLIVDDAFINLWSYGKITVNVNNTLWADISNNGQLIYLNTPNKIQKKTKNGGRIVTLNDAETIKNPQIEYINFKIKNNSSNRNHFYVVGPKPDGSKFSYGFPMMPNSKRDENWTTGTKVYKVNRLGFKKLLITITKTNENQIVDLFN